MRVAAILSALIVLAPGAAAATLQTASPASASRAPNCPATTRYLAGRYQGRPLAPKKLNQLPAATTYMAVYRRIGPCEAPLTMAEYRNLRRR